MKKAASAIILSLVALTQLQGCATAVVGGAAAGASVIHDRRSAGTVVDDKSISIKVMSKMMGNAELREHSSLSATSYNRLVLLTGQAENTAYRNEFGRIAATTPMVKRVVNEVQIGPNATLSEQTQDSWITSKIKVELFEVKLPSFDPTRVKVITEKGVVYLMGMVTPQEADAVVEKVRYVRGVKKVVRVFEYL